MHWLHLAAAACLLLMVVFLPASRAFVFGAPQPGGAPGDWMSWLDDDPVAPDLFFLQAMWWPALCELARRTCR